MRVLLTSEARFERAPDGAVWGPAACGRALWQRYLEVFASAQVAARVSDVHTPSPGMVQASQPGVEFLPLPSYAGAAGLVQNFRLLSRAVERAVRDSEAIIVRTPSPVAYVMSRAAAAAGRPFGAEVVGDPHDVFSPGAYAHRLRPALRLLAAAAQRRVVAGADAVLYVTGQALQRRYPAGGRSYAASDVALCDEAFTTGVVRARKPDEPLVVVTVTALDQPYKGTTILLDAMSRLRRGDARVRLRIVGGGRLLGDLRQRCEAMGLADHVEFLGQQTQAGVREALDSAHLFVLPSLQEGLPRALLEAMARGLAAVATNVGGVPELLPAECLVPPRRPEALAVRISQMLAHEADRQQMAQRNRTRALDYHERLQAPVRRGFLTAIERASRLTEARCA